MMPGMPERRIHDYIRHGITTLFAALDISSGQVIGSIHRRHRAMEFKKLLAKLDKEIPADLEVHLICDNNDTTHKRPPSRSGWRRECVCDRQGCQISRVWCRAGRRVLPRTCVS